MEYKQKLKDAIVQKQKKLLESYYILKAISMGNSHLENVMREFVGSGKYPNDMREFLCILFSDIDPELYDLDIDQKRVRLQNIFSEVFNSGKILTNVTIKKQSELTLCVPQRTTVKPKSTSHSSRIDGRNIDMNKRVQGLIITPDEDHNDINTLITQATRQVIDSTNDYGTEFTL